MDPVAMMADPTNIKFYNTDSLSNVLMWLSELKY